MSWYAIKTNQSINERYKFIYLILNTGFPKQNVYTLWFIINTIIIKALVSFIIEIKEDKV